MSARNSNSANADVGRSYGKGLAYHKNRLKDVDTYTEDDYEHLGEVGENRHAFKEIPTGDLVFVDITDEDDERIYRRIYTGNWTEKDWK